MSGKARLIDSCRRCNPVLQDHQRQMHAEIGAGDAHAGLYRERLVELQNGEHVHRRGDQHRNRRNKPEEQVGHVWRLAAIPGLNQLQASLFLADPFAQVELVDHRLHVLLGGRPQIDLIAARHALTLALAHFLTLERNGSHALVERVAGDERHGQCQHRGAGRDCSQHHRERFHIDRFNQQFEHGAPLKIEVDHLLHHHRAHEHPERRCSQHQAAQRFCPKQRDV